MAGGADTRPLSPHVSVWRWHVTMFTSIGHRVSGVVLYLGVLAMAGWLVLLAMGPEAYNAVFAALPAWLVWAALYALTAAAGFHAANGVRHLVFDVGKGFQPKTANFSAWLVIVFALAAPVGLYLMLHR